MARPVSVPLSRKTLHQAVLGWSALLVCTQGQRVVGCAGRLTVGVTPSGAGSNPQFTGFAQEPPLVQEIVFRLVGHLRGGKREPRHREVK